MPPEIGMMPLAGVTLTRRPRRNHSPACLAKVALAAIRGGKTMSELTEQFDVHPNQISTWREQLLASAGDVFGAAKPDAPVVDAKKLHAKIGQLTLENDAPQGLRGLRPRSLLRYPTRSARRVSCRAESDDRQEARPTCCAASRDARDQPGQRLLSAATNAGC